MGLYDDDRAAVTSGDVADVIYFQTKFAYDKLEAALKTRQPEYQFHMLTVDVINGSADVLQRFANHEDVKRWKQRAEEIAKKADGNAPPQDFNGKFAHWRDHSYEMSWRSFHMAKA